MIACPLCKSPLKRDYRSDSHWLVCCNSQCRASDISQGQFCTIYEVTKDFILPLFKSAKIYVARSNSYKGTIGIYNKRDQLTVEIPFFPFNPNDLNVTINRIKLLVTYI